MSQVTFSTFAVLFTHHHVVWFHKICLGFYSALSVPFPVGGALSLFLSCCVCLIVLFCLALSIFSLPFLVCLCSS